jgi:hypothetical protein
VAARALVDVLILVEWNIVTATRATSNSEAQLKRRPKASNTGSPLTTLEANVSAARFLERDPDHSESLPRDPHPTNCLKEKAAGAMPVTGPASSSSAFFQNHLPRQGPLLCNVHLLNLAWSSK